MCLCYVVVVVSRCLPSSLSGFALDAPHGSIRVPPPAKGYLICGVLRASARLRLSCWGCPFALLVLFVRAVVGCSGCAPEMHNHAQSGLPPLASESSVFGPTGFFHWGLGSACAASAFRARRCGVFGLRARDADACAKRCPSSGCAHASRGFSGFVGHSYRSAGSCCARSRAEPDMRAHAGTGSPFPVREYSSL